jgi:hypothetical protein
MLFEKIQLEPDEKIITIVHRHWFVIFSQAVGVAVITLAPLLAWILVGTLATQNTTSIQIDLSAYTSYFFYFYSIWLLLNWVTLAHMWTTHHLDIWVVTNRRIIRIDQVSLFRRKIGSFRLEKLQDVNIEIDGLIATFLDYGSVDAQTASGSHDDDFKTTYIPHPGVLKSIILKAADERMKNQNNLQRSEE